MHARPVRLRRSVQCSAVNNWIIQNQVQQARTSAKHTHTPKKGRVGQRRLLLITGFTECNSRGPMFGHNIHYYCYGHEYACLDSGWPIHRHFHVVENMVGKRATLFRVISEGASKLAVKRRKSMREDEHDQSGQPYSLTPIAQCGHSLGFIESIKCQVKT